MSAVLITILNGTKILDSGTGVVVRRHGGKCYVLTCAHNLRALSSRIATTGDNPVRIMVNGHEAKDNGDAALARRDLAVLTVDGEIAEETPLTHSKSTAGLVQCRGYTRFFQDQFEHRAVDGRIQRLINTVMPDGTATQYIEIEPKSGTFEKGLSGAPVFRDEKLVGIARMLSDRSGPEKESQKVVGYAIRLSPEVIKLVQEKVPANSGVAKKNDDRPPVPKAPAADSLANDDIQKNRWGGKSENFGRRLAVERIREFSRYFMFDAVLLSTDNSRLVGPFIFHLHDTFAKPVIWIRRTDGLRAALEEIEASGTFTLGVQFKDEKGIWRSLELDLAEIDDGKLARRYDS